MPQALRFSRGLGSGAPGPHFLDELAVAQCQDSIAESRGQVIVRDKEDSSVIFTMQIVADQPGIQTRPAQLADALFLTHPALMAHVETLRSQSIPVRVTVKKRLDQFGEF